MDIGYTFPADGAPITSTPNIELHVGDMIEIHGITCVITAVSDDRCEYTIEPWLPAVELVP